MVCNCAGYSNTAVSELVFGLALSLYRYIPQCNEVIRQGGDKTGLIGLELEGKKFGVVGMGAIILNGAVIGNDCIVGAGAVVTGKMNAPAGSMILGNPAKVVRPLSEEEIAGNRANARHYVQLAAKGLSPVTEQENC